MAKSERSKKSKVLTSVAAVVLAASMLIGGGTYAYLQGESDDVINEFNANQVTVDLKETTGNSYEIIPGTTQKKDPKVTVNATVPAYLFVTVEDETDGLVDYAIADGWTKLDGYDNVYYREVAASDAAQEFDVLAGNTVSYDAALENSDMTDEEGNLKDGLALSFKAYAIQKDPFNDPADAYLAKDAVKVEDAESLQKQIDSGSSVILVSGDIKVTESVRIPEGKNVKLVLSGTVTADNADAIVVENGAAFELSGGKIVAAPAKAAVYNEGTATIENITITRSEESTTNDAYVIVNHGAMTLEKGVYVQAPASGSSMIENGYQNGSSATESVKMVINGGTYIGGLNPVKNDDWGVLEINDGYFENQAENQYSVVNMNELTINGGEFYSVGPVIWTGSLDTGYDKGIVYVYNGYFETEQKYPAFYVNHNFGGYTDDACYYFGACTIKMNTHNYTELGTNFCGPTHTAYHRLEGTGYPKIDYKNGTVTYVSEA